MSQSAGYPLRVVDRTIKLVAVPPDDADETKCWTGSAHGQQASDGTIAVSENAS
jgi:hypothetical protein